MTGLAQVTEEDIQAQKSERSAGKSSEETQEIMGPLHIHLLNKTLSLTKASLKGDDAEKEKLQKFISSLHNWKDLIESCQIFKKTKVYDSKFRKLELAIQEDRTVKRGTDMPPQLVDIWPTVHKYIASQAGYKRLPGGVNFCLILSIR